MTRNTLILWRPVGQSEHDLIAASGWRAFPPRLEGLPIFWVPADELDEFNRHIVGAIEVVAEYR